MGAQTAHNRTTNRILGPSESDDDSLVSHWKFTDDAHRGVKNTETGQEITTGDTIGYIVSRRKTKKGTLAGAHAAIVRFKAYNNKPNILIFKWVRPQCSRDCPKNTPCPGGIKCRWSYRNVENRNTKHCRCSATWETGTPREINLKINWQREDILLLYCRVCLKNEKSSRECPNNDKDGHVLGWYHLL